VRGAVLALAVRPKNTSLPLPPSVDKGLSPRVDRSRSLIVSKGHYVYVGKYISVYLQKCRCLTTNEGGCRAGTAAIARLPHLWQAARIPPLTQPLCVLHLRART